MTTVATDLRRTRESARRLRFEPTGAITQTNVQKAIEQASTQQVAVVPTSIAFANSPYTPTNSDTFLYVDTAGGAITVNLQAAAARAGLALVIKDVTGHGATNNITLTPNGAETVDGLAPMTINSDFGGVRLNPVTGGYTVSP